MLDFATAPAAKTPGFKVVRDAAAAAGWTMRFFCPSYTVYASPDGSREITVWFFQSSGNLEGANLVDSTAEDIADWTIIERVKRSGLTTLLGWFAA